MHILPERLRQLRARAEYSRPDLARRSKISVRQIARIEGAADDGVTVRDSTGEKLAKALNIDPKVLEGATEMPAAPQPNRSPGPTNFDLHYDLIRRRYGVTQVELFRAAPLMFILLAEGSLIWRREVAEQAAELDERLTELGRQTGNWGYIVAGGRASETVWDELQSVKEGNLRGTDSEGAMNDLGYNMNMFDDDEYGHAFTQYLRHLVKTIDKPGTVQERCPDGWWSESLLGTWINFLLLEEELGKVVGETGEARLALECGDVRIKDIPEELWQDRDAASGWIQDRIPEGGYIDRIRRRSIKFEL